MPLALPLAIPLMMPPDVVQEDKHVGARRHPPVTASNNNIKYVVCLLLGQVDLKPYEKYPGYESWERRPLFVIIIGG